MPVALVTGASSGIGATFARALAARGYDLVLVARRLERLDHLAGEVSAKHGVKTETLAADLSDDAQRLVVEERLARAPEVDLLVNNAGFGTLGRFWEASVESQDRMHRVHVLATMRLTHAALRQMVPRGHGAVINVSSVAGFVQSPGNVSYGATKGWMNDFTEGLSLELRSAGSPVKVQALCPGFTISEFHDVLGIDRKVIPGPLWMSTEQVVNRSLRGLDRGELFVVPGWTYKLIVGLVPALPRFIRHPVMLYYSRKGGRDV